MAGAIASVQKVQRKRHSMPICTAEIKDADQTTLQPRQIISNPGNMSDRLFFFFNLDSLGS